MLEIMYDNGCDNVSFDYPCALVVMGSDGRLHKKLPFENKGFLLWSLNATIKTLIDLCHILFERYI